MARRKHRAQRQGRNEREDGRSFKKHPYEEIASYLQEIKPKTRSQADFLNSIDGNAITLCDGPAGTGKSIISFYSALRALVQDKSVRRIIITRPTVLSGDDNDIGFLPGTLQDKMAPFLSPLLTDSASLLFQNDRFMTSGEQREFIAGILENIDIEIVPICYLRGRTFHSSFIILDEAQNCTLNDLKLFITRVGMRSKVVIEGDSTQSDIGRDSGFVELQQRLKGLDGVGIIKMGYSDIMRNPMIADVLKRLE